MQQDQLVKEIGELLNEQETLQVILDEHVNKAKEEPEKYIHYRNIEDTLTRFEMNVTRTDMVLWNLYKLNLFTYDQYVTLLTHDVFFKLKRKAELIMETLKNKEQ